VVVCILTGHGLKDPDIVVTSADALTVPADAAAIREAMRAS
jgi:threonine synthase